MFIQQGFIDQEIRHITPFPSPQQLHVHNVSLALLFLATLNEQKGLRYFQVFSWPVGTALKIPPARITHSCQSSWSHILCRFFIFCIPSYHMRCIAVLIKRTLRQIFPPSSIFWLKSHFEPLLQSSFIEALHCFLYIVDKVACCYGLKFEMMFFSFILLHLHW